LHEPAVPPLLLVLPPPLDVLLPPLLLLVLLPPLLLVLPLLLPLELPLLPLVPLPVVLDEQPQASRTHVTARVRFMRRRLGSRWTRFKPGVRGSLSC
jgi:hypothetical protein